MIATDDGFLHSRVCHVTATGSIAAPPEKPPSCCLIATGVDSPPGTHNRLPTSSKTVVQTRWCPPRPSSPAHRCLGLHHADRILAAHGGGIPSGDGGMILLGGGGGGGGILVVTSVQMASTAVEFHGGDDWGPKVDAGRWNPNNGDAILEAQLGNPRQVWGWGYK
jgi:hypothetical protein